MDFIDLITLRQNIMPFQTVKSELIYKTWKNFNFQIPNLKHRGHITLQFAITGTAECRQAQSPLSPSFPNFSQFTVIILDYVMLFLKYFSQNHLIISLATHNLTMKLISLFLTLEEIKAQRLHINFPRITVIIKTPNPLTSYFLGFPQLPVFRHPLM